MRAEVGGGIAHLVGDFDVVDLDAVDFMRAGDFRLCVRVGVFGGLLDLRLLLLLFGGMGGADAKPQGDDGTEDEAFHGVTPFSGGAV